jgi:hypothetical protein
VIDKRHLVSCLASLFLVTVQWAYGQDVVDLRGKQQAQERARLQAGELIAGVLDLQLRQLRENGLSDLPIYEEIAAMKGTLSGLARSDMEEIVRLLVAAEEGPPHERLDTYNAARAKIREVVGALMAERLKLRRRMQLARLAADVEQLIAMQTKTHETTRSLEEQTQQDRERAALLTMEDQADVQKLYEQLVAALKEISAWEHPAAVGAAAGLKVLESAQVETHLKQAAGGLARGEFPAAAKSQGEVLKGLAALLERLQEVQGVPDADHQEFVREVRQMLDRQQQLQERTQQAEFNEQTLEPLIAEQSALQKELGELAKGANPSSSVERRLDEAAAAASSATERLFQEQKSEALEQQSQVIGNLAEIEKALGQMNAAAADNNAKGEGQGESSESGQPMPASDSSSDKKGTKKGQSTGNQSREPGDPSAEPAPNSNAAASADTDQASASGSQMKLENETWFAKLPPSVRAAIQAKSRGKAPRGYEERLRRYFESKN